MAEQYYLGTFILVQGGGGRGRESGERVFWIGQKRSMLFSVPIYVQSCSFTVPTPFHCLLNKEAHNKPLLLIKPH